MEAGIAPTLHAGHHVPGGRYLVDGDRARRRPVLVPTVRRHVPAGR